MDNKIARGITFDDTPGNADGPASNAVIEAVASAKEISPVDLQPPLYSVVDPDALDQFVDTSTDVDARVEFQYSGFDVAVSGDGDVSLGNATGAK